MGSVRCSISVDGVVSIAVVGYDDSLVSTCLGCLYDILNTVVDSVDSLSDSVVDACMAYHISVGEIDDDEVILLCHDSRTELVLHLVG